MKSRFKEDGPYSKHTPKSLYFIYNNGVVDYVAVDLAHAKEMASHPETGKTDEFVIERWVKTRTGHYNFDKRFQ